jgi:hypothetical protein
MRQSGWAHFARRGEQSETEAILTEDPVEGGPAHEDLRKCPSAGGGVGGKAALPLQWCRKLDLAESGEELARPSTHEASFRKQAQQLKRLLAEKVLEVDFFKGVV